MSRIFKFNSQNVRAHRWSAVIGRGLLVLLCCLGSTNTGLAGGITWKHDLKQAAREAKTSQKPLLLEFTASWCHYCKKMLNTTFRDEGVARHVNGCFVPVSVDYDRNDKLVRAVGVTTLPTTVVISPKLTVVKKISGYQTPRQFHRQLKGLCPHDDASASKRPFGGDAVASTKPPTPNGSRTSAPIAFGGQCLVSMLDDHKHRQGDEQFSLRYRGRRLVFASAEYRKRFQANPTTYWPANNGMCPVTRYEQQQLKAGKPDVAVIYRKQLWFFATQEHRKTFAANPARFAAAATAEEDEPQ